jgi:hypothetical protein
MLALSSGSVLASTSDCDVQVSPKAAAAGSVFVFSGSGFKPTSLELQKNHDEPIVHTVSVGADDPWRVTVRSRIGDEGRWTATFTDETSNCTATAGFRVTLTSTDVVDDLSTAAATRPAVIGFFAGVLIFGLTGGVFMGRHIQARARIRS